MIFSAKSSRAIRMLLCHPQKQWYVKKLSEKARISIGQASKLKERLLEYEYITELWQIFYFEGILLYF